MSRLKRRMEPSSGFVAARERIGMYYGTGVMLRPASGARIHILQCHVKGLGHSEEAGRQAGIGNPGDTARAR